MMQGCDGSVLLDGSAGGPSEQTAVPNLTLRKRSFKIIDDLRKRIQDECGQVVSCSDITAIAARDSVVLVSKTTSSIFVLIYMTYFFFSRTKKE